MFCFSSILLDYQSYNYNCLKIQVLSLNIDISNYVCGIDLDRYTETGQVIFHTRLEVGSSKNSKFIYLDNWNLSNFDGT